MSKVSLLLEAFKLHNNVVGYEIRDHITHLPNSHLYLGKHSSYRLELWFDNFFIILPYFNRIQKLPFNASLWRLTALDRRLVPASNIGSVK